MKLLEYLKKNKIKQVDFCKKIGYTIYHINNYLRGRNKITPRLAQIIFIATGGEVSVAELLKDNPPKTVTKKTKNEDQQNEKTVLG